MQKLVKEENDELYIYIYKNIIILKSSTVEICETLAMRIAESCTNM